MGMEAISGIAGMQVQNVIRPVVSPKSNEAVMDEGKSASVTVPKLDNTTKAAGKSSESNNGKAGYESQENAQPNQESLKRAVENINKNLQDSEAVFGIHEKTNRVTIKIVDKETKEVIKELPPEKTLDMIAKAWELAGLLVDEKR